jgi:hypothetical protein
MKQLMQIKNGIVTLQLIQNGSDIVTLKFVSL